MIEFYIIEDLGTISANKKGSEKKLVKIEWGDNDPIYEIREFAADGRAFKRPGLNFEEMKTLKKILNEHEEF